MQIVSIHADHATATVVFCSRQKIDMLRAYGIKLPPRPQCAYPASGDQAADCTRDADFQAALAGWASDLNSLYRQYCEWGTSATER